MKKIALYLGTLTVLIVLLVASLTVFQGSHPPVHAATSSCPTGEASCLDGWAWSSNVGWISFNSNDSGSSAKYDVSVDSSGNLGGYAWSSNVGWISFNAADLQATSPCTGVSPVKVNLSSGSVSGWARVISEEGRSDGWDGCIELSGSSHETITGLSGTATSSQGVSYNSTSGLLSGFAWGSTVMGWLQFTPTLPNGKFNPVCISSADYPCGGGGTPSGDLTLSATNQSGQVVPAPTNGTAVIDLQELSANGQVTTTINWSYDPSIITVVSVKGDLSSQVSGATNGINLTYNNADIISSGGKKDTLIFNYSVTSGGQKNNYSKSVQIDVSPYSSSPDSCLSPSNSTPCGTQTTGPATTVSQCSTPVKDCEFQCLDGYRAQGGQCVKSSIHEF